MWVKPHRLCRDTLTLKKQDYLCNYNTLEFMSNVILCSRQIKFSVYYYTFDVQYLLSNVILSLKCNIVELFID